MEHPDAQRIIFQNPEARSREEILTQKKQNNYILWLITGVIGLMFTLVVALIIVGVNLITRNNTSTISTPTPTIVEEQPITTIVSKSKFATDAGVLKLREDLTKLRSDIDTTDLFETQLSPPNIDLNITIQSTN
jgi:hypothetical protein